MRLSGLPPYPPPDARILVLGSFPSAESLRKREYYGFSRNHFWPLVAALFGEDAPAGYEGRLALLGRHGVALWDVIASCERTGSLDADIGHEEPNRIPELLARLPGVERIALNGSKAASSFARHFGGAKASPIGAPFEWTHDALPRRRFSVARLPSTSPVPTRDYRSMDDKLPIWKAWLAQS